MDLSCPKRPWKGRHPGHYRLHHCQRPTGPLTNTGLGPSLSFLLCHLSLEDVGEGGVEERITQTHPARRQRGSQWSLCSAWTTSPLPETFETLLENNWASVASLPSALLRNPWPRALTAILRGELSTHQMQSSVYISRILQQPWGIGAVTSPSPQGRSGVLCLKFKNRERPWRDSKYALKTLMLVKSIF